MNNANEIVNTFISMVNLIIDLRDDKHYSDFTNYRLNQQKLQKEIEHCIKLLKTP